MMVTVISIVIGALGTISKGLVKGLKELEIGGRAETIQTPALLRSARILRWVLETRGDLLSFTHQWKTISKRLYEKLAREKYNNTSGLMLHSYVCDKNFRHSVDNDAYCHDDDGNDDDDTSDDVDQGYCICWCY